MFSLVTKIIKRATQYPIAILVISFVLALLSIYPVQNLRWELQLQDALTSKGSSPLYHQEIEEKFGALGSLTVVMESEDSTLNYSAARSLYQRLQADSTIHFAEFETDIEFYKKHSLLYIEEDDLDTVANRIQTLQEKITLAHNPLYVDRLLSIQMTTRPTRPFLILLIWKTSISPSFREPTPAVTEKFGLLTSILKIPYPTYRPTGTCSAKSSHSSGTILNMAP